MERPRSGPLSAKDNLLDADPSGKRSAAIELPGDADNIHGERGTFLT